jgi:hypothetical protein
VNCSDRQAEVILFKLRMKKPSKLVLTFAILWVLLSLCQCSPRPSWPVYARDGKEYGKVDGAFRHRWWNYYERGLSYAEGEYYHEALSDFREAIDQRSEDQRMARTYGMHFIDYFPHREAGIVYYRTAKLEPARKELELSLTHFPTAKAKFYLDFVRKAIIEQTGEEVTPPRVTLDFETREIWTQEDPVFISGKAEDEQFVAAIAIRGTPLFLEGSAKRIHFKEPLVLVQGRHAIEVEARNLLGKATKQVVVIHVDRQGPLITIDELDVGQASTGPEVAISGFIHDEAGVVGLFINEDGVSIQTGVEIRFSKRLTLVGSGLRLMAVDRLGNRTAGHILLPPVSSVHASTLLASADSHMKSDFFVGFLGARDTRPPSIQLNGWTDTQTVFLEKVYLEGQVRDESRVESLTINQVPILRRKGQSILFSHLAALEEGENPITIEARDEAGNVATKTITVIRRTPKALQLGERLSLSILPFDHKGMASEASLSFQDNLIDALLDQNRFQVVERDKLNVILEEQKLSRSKLVDRRTALRMGRLAAAQSIMTGTIIETIGGIEVVGRMIDTETSEILATEDVYSEAKDLPALKVLAEGMAIKFHHEFPLLEGLVIECMGRHICTDLGQNEIKLKRRLIVYRERPITHPVTGKALGADTEIIDHARVTQVLPEMSKAELLEAKEEKPRTLDSVITQ